MMLDWHRWYIRRESKSEKIEIHFSAMRHEIRKTKPERSRKHLPIGIFLFFSLKSTIIAWTVVIDIIRSHWIALREPSWQSLIWSEDLLSTIPYMVVPWYRGASASILSAIRVEAFECWSLPKRIRYSYRISYIPVRANGRKKST